MQTEKAKMPTRPMEWSTILFAQYIKAVRQMDAMANGKPWERMLRKMVYGVRCTVYGVRCRV